MLVTMFAFVMAGLPTHAEGSECDNCDSCFIRGNCHKYTPTSRGPRNAKDCEKAGGIDCKAKRPTAKPTAKAKPPAKAKGPQPIKDCAEEENHILFLNEEIKRANSKTKRIAHLCDNDLRVSREVLERVEEEKSTCERNLKFTEGKWQQTRVETSDHIAALEGQLRNTQHNNHEFEQSAIEWKNQEAKLYSRKKKLEADVVTCKEEIDELYHQLMHTKMNRDKLVATVSSMRTKMSDLEDKLDGCQR